MTSAPRNPAASRRMVLGAALGAGSLAALSACGGGDSATPAAGGAGDAAGATGDASSPPAGAAGALVATAKVPVGGGVILEAEKIVVTQPSEGTFKAFTAVCTHRGCTVGSVASGTITCPCHGSAFSATDGSVENGPATRPLREIAVAVEGADVVRG